MKKGDQVFFYHSNAEPSGIAGIAEVMKEGYPDPSQFNPQDHHYDPASKKDKPVWYVVDLGFVEKFEKVISLDQLRKIKGLEKMLLLQRGQRLSVMPVTEQEWKIILRNFAGVHAAK